MTACVYPWIHVSTHTTGNLRLCCNSSGPLPRDEDGKTFPISEQGIRDYWNSGYVRDVRRQMVAGERPVACSTCYALEDRGASSPRMIANSRFPDHLSRVGETTEDGSAPLHVAYVDLRLGNLCNLRCRMCGPYSSHLLAEEWRELFPDQMQTYRFDGSWADDIIKVVGGLKPHVDNIEEIYLTGGEPTLVKSHEPLLRAMIDMGISSRIKLRYNTNATNFPDHLLELWKSFAVTRLSMSIDAVGDLARYIRYPSNWKAIEQNIRRVDAIDAPYMNASITTTVQILNAMNLTDLMDFCATFRRIPRRPYWNILHNPQCLDARVLPDGLRHQAIERLLEWEERHDDLPPNQSGQTVDGLVAHLRSGDRSYLLRDFFKRNDAMDRHRGGMKLRDVLPALDAVRPALVRS